MQTVSHPMEASVVASRRDSKDDAPRNTTDRQPEKWWAEELKKIDPELEIRWGYPPSFDSSKCDCWVIGRRIEFEGREKGFRDFTGHQMTALYQYHEWVPMATLRKNVTSCGCRLEHKNKRCEHGNFGEPYDPGQRVFDAIRLTYHYRENGGTALSGKERYEQDEEAAAKRERERKKMITEEVRKRRRAILSGDVDHIGSTAAYAKGHSSIWIPGDRP